MKTLRVLVAEAPIGDHPIAWALFDDAGACVAEGRDAPRNWPAADRVEAVLAASQVRIASVRLPPVAAARIAAAAAFAVEDQLAGPPEARHLAVSRQGADGLVRVVVAERAQVDKLRRETAARFACIVAEPDLAVPAAGWRWCADPAGDREGFVRRSDGGAFPASPPAAGGALPPELALALAQAARDGHAPADVRVDAKVADADLARWHRDAGVRFVRGSPWNWKSAVASPGMEAVDLLQGALALAPSPSPRRVGRLFAPAVALAATALALHVGATVVEWGALKFESRRQAGQWIALAEAAGVAPEARTTPEAAQAGLARRYADLRHQNGLASPDDALPLLARAAPALRTLPAGAVKSATYTDGHWTLDLARADPAAMAELDARLKQAGVPALVAATAGGARLRMGALR